VFVVFAQQHLDRDDAGCAQRLSTLDCLVQHGLSEHDLMHL
jgi:hypothetical protein